MGRWESPFHGHRSQKKEQKWSPWSNVTTLMTREEWASGQGFPFQESQHVGFVCLPKHIRRWIRPLGIKLMGVGKSVSLKVYINEQ